MRDSQKPRAYRRERLIRTDSTVRLTFCRGLRRLTVVAAVLALLLVACTSPPLEAGPSTSSPTTVIATTAQAPPPSTAVPTYQPATADGPAQNVPVPVLPAEAKEFSKEGLLAFSKYWYETLGYAFETGDPEPMMDVSDPACKTCAFVNKPIGQLYEDGGWVVGGQMTVHDSSSTFRPASDNSYQAILLVQQMKVTAYSEDKVIVNEYPQRRARANMVVAVYQDQGWQALSAEPLDDN